MISADLKVARRSLLKHKAYTLITTAGLAAGAAACLLMSLYVRNELNFDSYHRDGKRVFRLLVKSSFSKGKPSASASDLAAPTLIRDYPEVETAARILRGWRAPLLRAADKVFAEPAIFQADPALFPRTTGPRFQG